VTAAEIYFEHDSASFGSKMMWLPVSLGPVGAAAGVAGFCSRRMAKTALPITSAAIVANGLQGLCLHARGIAQKPGGWRNARYNMEMGPRCWLRCWSPWWAGWACWPPSCGGSSERRPQGGPRSGRPVPGFRRSEPGPPLGPGDHRGGHGPEWAPAPPRFFTGPEAACARALLNLLTGQDEQDGELAVPVLEMVGAQLEAGQTDGWRYADMPEDGQAWRDTLGHLDADADRRCGTSFPQADQVAMVQAVQDSGRAGVEPVDQVCLYRLLRSPVRLGRDRLSRTRLPARL
jgi:hypothetical protein